MPGRQMHRSSTSAGSSVNDVTSRIRECLRGISRTMQNGPVSTDELNHCEREVIILERNFRRLANVISTTFYKNSFLKTGKESEYISRVINT